MSISPTDAPMLDEALLEEYADRIRARGVPFDEWTEPGLSQDEIDTTMEPVGLTLPDEARVWWGWRNGFARGGGFAFFPGFSAVPLAEAVDVYQMMRHVAANTAEPGLPTRETADELWWPGWFPLDRDNDHFVVDCSVAPGEPTPIRIATWELLADESWPPRARSFGEAVTRWCEAMDLGAVVWQADPGAWVRGEIDRPWPEVPGWGLKL